MDASLMHTYGVDARPRLEDLLDEYEAESRCEAYNGRPKRRASKDVRAEIDAVLERLKGDAEIGRQWREDSNLEKWFPLTADRLAAKERENLHLAREARTWWEAAQTYATSEAKLADALTELVALEDMRLRLRELHEMGRGTDYYDYHRRLPLAWGAARAALGPNA